METIVISVGGSLIVPGEIDIDFLNDLKEFILEQVHENKRFVIVTGGGRTARRYQEAGRALTSLAEEDVDWLGIHATRINAHLVRSMLRREAHPLVYHHLEEDIEFSESVLVAAGWKPGWSTDYVAVRLAEKLGAKRVLNMSNIDHVYDKDPNAYRDAEPLEEVSWEDYRKLIPDKWVPGLSSPFDPVASEKAEELGLEVVILNGDVDNVKRYMDGEDFRGTLIH